MSPYENGHCFTYNPPKKSSTDFISRLLFMLSAEDAWDHEYDIFIHEKNQFWPRSDMQSFGQPKAVTIKQNDEVEISFKIKHIHRRRTNINKCSKVILISNALSNF